MFNYKKLKYKKTFLLLFSLSFLSLLQTSMKALENSCDLQWQPAKLLSQGINHYQYFMYHGGEVFMCQQGEYAHGLQVILLPLAYLEWDTAKLIWLFTNLILVFFIPILLCKKFNVSNELTLFVLFIFFTCSPTRSAIYLGQHSLFTMFFFILPFLYKNNFSYFFSGLSYFKYSIGLILAFYFLFCKKYKIFFISVIPSIIGWIIYFMMTNSDPITNLFEPLILTMKKDFLEDSNLYSLISQIHFLELKNINIFQQTFKLYPNTFFILNKSIILLLFIFLIFFYIKIILNSNNDLAKLSIICLMVLVFLPHARYEYIFLLPLLILSLKNVDKIIFKFNIGVIIYYFYFTRPIKHFINHDEIYDVFIFLIFLSQLTVNAIYLKNENNKLQN